MATGQAFLDNWRMGRAKPRVLTVRNGVRRTGERPRTRAAAQRLAPFIFRVPARTRWFLVGRIPSLWTVPVLASFSVGGALSAAAMVWLALRADSKETNDAWLSLENEAAVLWREENSVSYVRAVKQNANVRMCTKIVSPAHPRTLPFFNRSVSAIYRRLRQSEWSPPSSTRKRATG